MKLKKIEVSNNNRNSGRPVLTVSKTGRFSLSPTMRDKIEYVVGDEINFYQDEESLKDWYIHLTNDGSGTKLQEKESGKYTSVFIQKGPLATEIRKSFATDNAMVFSIGIPTDLEGQQYWPLLFNK